MRTTTIIICCSLSAFSALSCAAPTILPVDSGAIIEEPPEADALTQEAHIHRFVHDPNSRDQAKEPVNLWIDDFGNIEIIPAPTPQSQALFENAAHAQEGRDIRNKALDLYSMIDDAYMTNFRFTDGLSGSIVYFISGLLICLMMVLVFTMFNKRSRSTLYAHEKDGPHLAL